MLLKIANRFRTCAVEFYPKMGTTQSSSHNHNDIKYYLNYDANIWLRSCEKEILAPIKGVTTGIIPEWLQGTLLRNGIGSLKVGNQTVAHLFDASALIHRFCIENGEVTYQCRFLQSDVYKKQQQAKRIVLTQFGTKAVRDPCHSIFEGFKSIFNPKSPRHADNSIISIFPFGDAVYALNEVPAIHRINPVTLATEEKVFVSDYVSIVHHTAHPHLTEDGSVYNLGLTIYPTGPHHTIVKFPARESDKEMFENGKIIGEIPARWPLHPSYMHSFGITENFFIIVEQPLNLSLPALFLSKITDEPVVGSIRSYPDEMTQINLIDRKTGKLAYKFYSDAFFYFHIINQYEIGDYVIIDICTYEDPSLLEFMYTETMKTIQQNPDFSKIFFSKPIRFVLPLKPHYNNNNKENLIKLSNSQAEAYFLPSGEIFVKGENLCELGCEAPQINYQHYSGKPYRYFYVMALDITTNNPGAIIKVDIDTKTTKMWHAPNCYASEPIFVPTPDSKSEDDGVVLSAIVWDGDDTNRVGLVILDGKSFKEIGRVEFQTPSPVPKCFHGWFLPSYRKL